MKKFRYHHILDILHQSEQGSLPIDAFLSSYFRTHKAVGSNDRQEICDTLYDMIRWRGLLDYLCQKPITWKQRLDIYLTICPINFLSKNEIPLHVRLSFPKFAFNFLLSAYGEKNTIDFCLNSNESAPTTIRVNSLKISRDDLLKKWEGIYEMSPCSTSPYGIRFNRRINFFALPEFKEGMFELQDEGSQLVADHIHPEPGAHILDYCAGSGGKTLAFAPKMEGKGQIYLYDIRPQILLQAKKRLKRAGIQNAQIVDEKKLKKKGFLKRMNWILLDVPCSGSGTLRRNPDIKWRWTQDSLGILIEEQRKIFDRALRFLHPNGKIVYATCSVFPEENENQISYFMEKYNLQLIGLPFHSSPKKNEMDGFFCAVLSLK